MTCSVSFIWDDFFLPVLIQVLNFMDSRAVLLSDKFEKHWMINLQNSGIANVGDCWPIPHREGGGKPSVWQAIPAAPTHLLCALWFSCWCPSHGWHGRLPTGTPRVWSSGVLSPHSPEFSPPVKPETVSHSRSTAMKNEKFLFALLFLLALNWSLMLQCSFCLCKLEIINSTYPTSPDSYFENQMIYVKWVWTL